MNWLCLSGDRDPLYVDDVVRAVSYPVGATLRFRYEESLVGPQALDRIRSGRADQDVATLCFVSKSPNRAAQVIPVRRGTIVGAEQVGSLVALEFRLTSYVRVEDVEEYTASAIATFDSLQHLQRPDPDTLRPYCCVGTRPPAGETLSNCPEAWEKVVFALSTCDAFRDRKSFFRIEGFRDWKKRTLNPSSNGVWKLQSGARYWLRVSHWHPGAHPEGPNRRLHLETGSTALRFDRNQVDLRSRYDVQPIRLRVDPVARGLDTVVVVSESVATDPPKLSWFLDIPIEVTVQRTRAVGYVLLLTILLAGPDLVGGEGIWRAVAVVALSFFAVLTFTLGYKNPPSV